MIIFFAFNLLILRTAVTEESLHVPINDGVYAEITSDGTDGRTFYHNPHFHDLSRSRITSRLEKSSRGRKK